MIRQHCWGRPEYWHESWRLEETCCHSDSSEKPSANTDVINSRGVIIIIIIMVNKEKIQKGYCWRTRKLLETKLSRRNLIKGINTWTVPIVRYSGSFLQSTRDELKQMDQKTRTLMTMHRALHPRDDVDRLYVSRKEGGRALTQRYNDSKTTQENMKEDC